jgi:hypothetical protein
MSSLQTLENVFYPPVGIAHITEEIAHLIEHRMAGKRAILLRSSAQPNSHPHLGTVMTLMTAFALGKHFSDYFSVPVSLVYDILDNSPGEQFTANGNLYQRSLSDTLIDGRSLADQYTDSFRSLITVLSTRSGISAVIRTYEEFQSLPIVRKTLLTILQRRDSFYPIVSPSEKRLHLRFPCPVCKYQDKHAANVRIEEITETAAVLASTCYQHGDYRITLSERSSDFIDANTPLRDVLQGVLAIEEDSQSNITSVMVDGGDWSGVWILTVFSAGLAQLGYSRLPSRFFAPVIVDWSGAKFSKSLYLENEAYHYLPSGLVDFSKFMSMYGEEGFDRLWNEAESWVKSPKKFFRNYSVDYLRLILEGK